MSKRDPRTFSFRPAAVACIALLALGRVGCAWAEQYSQDAVKAAFLYRFAGYVEWPQHTPPDTPFTIAVLGDDGVASELEKLLPGRLIKDRPAHVMRIRMIRDLGNAQILYVGPERRAAARAVIEAVATRPVLVVTDEEGGLDEGSTVNFLLVDRRVRFEISLAAAERSGLRISSELLSVAARVQGGRLRSDNSWFFLSSPETLAGLRRAPGWPTRRRVS